MNTQLPELLLESLNDGQARARVKMKAIVRMRYESELSYGRYNGPPPSSARRAAVIVLLFPGPDGWRFPLTLRPDAIGPHAGQISLPGGAIEAGETSDMAAVRELEEELGVPSDNVKLLGSLDDLYIFGSNYHVTPWLGVIDDSPKWIPQHSEVAEVIEMTVSQLLNTENLHSTIRTLRGVSFQAPNFAIDGHQIWGATCLILGELRELLRQVTTKSA